MALETAATLICMALAPTLFKYLSVHMTIAISGVVTLLAGWFGWVRYREGVFRAEAGALSSESVAG
jgi:hypothetical protein